MQRLEEFDKRGHHWILVYADFHLYIFLNPYKMGLEDKQTSIVLQPEDSENGVQDSQGVWKARELERQSPTICM